MSNIHDGICFGISSLLNFLGGAFNHKVIFLLCLEYLFLHECQKVDNYKGMEESIIVLKVWKWSRFGCLIQDLLMFPAERQLIYLDEQLSFTIFPICNDA